MTPNDSTTPTNAVDASKYLNAGRKLGAALILSTKHAKLVTPNVSRENIVTNGAKRLISPARSITCDSRNVNRTATMGSSDFAEPLRKGDRTDNRLSLYMGNMCSLSWGMIGLIGALVNTWQWLEESLQSQ